MVILYLADSAAHFFRGLTFTIMCSPTLLDDQGRLRRGRVCCRSCIHAGMFASSSLPAISRGAIFLRGEGETVIPHIPTDPAVSHRS
jgi:hypothetical protein